MLIAKDERYQGVEKHSSGFKLLASMGWKEGEGLVRRSASDIKLRLAAHLFSRQGCIPTPYLMQGAKRQGMKQHIKVKKNSENAGIGLVRPGFFSGCCTISPCQCLNTAQRSQHCDYNDFCFILQPQQ